MTGSLYHQTDAKLRREIASFARRVLLGATLQDKLGPPPAMRVMAPGDTHDAHDAKGTDDAADLAPAFTIPTFPGRPPELARAGKAPFPPLTALRTPGGRAQVLHFFANHELLAAELMALVLLRFPQTPIAFQQGLVRTIAEEQTHLKLYLDRMKALGLDLGDQPLSDYFWNAMHDVDSPLDFVVRMSLTFEQANLDYALFFRDAFAREGDAETATVLERVLRDEIGHVKHGLVWFNRWRGDAKDGPAREDEWSAYCRLLKAPLTPRRAKGLVFAAAPRRDAGLSEAFVRELEHCGGSKGRPPAVWLFNPGCEAEIARGRAGASPTAGAQRMTADLEIVPAFLAHADDVLVLTHTRERPRAEWLKTLSAIGIAAPAFAVAEALTGDVASAIAGAVRADKLSSLEPWGWSPDASAKLHGLKSRLLGPKGEWCQAQTATRDLSARGFGRVFSKSWSARLWRDWVESPDADPALADARTVADVVTTGEQARSAIEAILAKGAWAAVKAPFGTSGMGVRQIRARGELAGPLGGWIRNTLQAQGELVVETWLDKVCDLSIQLVVDEASGPEGDAPVIRVLGARRFVGGSRREYRGTYLGPKLAGFDADQRRFVHELLPAWKRLARVVGRALASEGYRGPAGIDALLWRDSSGALKIKPLVEVNPRWTMGRVALELEKHLAPRAPAVWAFLPVREITALGHADAAAFARLLAARYPAVAVTSEAGGPPRLSRGVVFTNDPERAQEVLTVLATLPNPDVEPFLIS